MKIRKINTGKKYCLKVKRENGNQRISKLEKKRVKVKKCE